ncbi:hypothetical protein MBANPS3_008602 [Mucor bainieri]
MLAAEILDKIFSYLAFPEIYRIRSVCKAWKQQCEYHLYLSAKAQRTKLYVKIGKKGRTTLVDMKPHQFDAENQPPQEDVDDNVVYLDQDTKYAKAQVQFSSWSQQEEAAAAQNSDLLLNLNLVDRAQVLFHLQYNPSMEQVHNLMLPKDGQNELHYVGDKGIIITYSYTSDSQEQPSHDVHFHGIDDSTTHTSSFNSTIFDQRGTAAAAAAMANSNPTKIRLRIRAIHANLSWLLSGFNTRIAPEPLYPKRYQVLANALSEHDNQHISAYSESVLKCIMTMSNNDDTLDPHALSQLLAQQPVLQDDGMAWKEALQAKLQSLGIDPRVIYKYTFVKNYMLQQHPPTARPDDVAKVIQESEEAWVIKKLNLIQELRQLE